jgi:hypothetical protein
MRFSTRTKNKAVSASSKAETPVASARFKITKKAHNKSPARGEETDEGEEYLPTVSSPGIKIKRKFTKKSKTQSANASTVSKTSIASTKSKIVAKANEKFPAGGEEAGEKVTLNDSDVLLGRGNGIASWVGNKNFRSIVLSYKDAYKNAFRQEKSFVSRQVIEDVHEEGGRFVERDFSGDHVEVPYEKALEKTCQCLREKPIGESEKPVAVLPKKCSKIIPAVKLSTSLASVAKRKGVYRPSKTAKKARTEEATKAMKILPSVTASMMTLKNNGPKKEPRVPQITLKKKPTKKNPQVPRKVIKAVKKSTSSNVATSATNIGSTYTSSGISTTVKYTKSEDDFRVQKLVDHAVQIKMMYDPGDLDEIFVPAPPNLSSFFSGIVSLSERSIHAVTGKGHSGADLLTLTPAVTPTHGKSLAVLKQAREKNARDTGNPESPTNATDFDRVMLEAICEPAFEPNQSSDFSMGLFEDSSAYHWPSHGYMG